MLMESAHNIARDDRDGSAMATEAMVNSSFFLISRWSNVWEFEAPRDFGG